jgi:hypothetical protein
MARRFRVEELPAAQFDFVVNCIIEGIVDEKISASLLERFDVKIPISSFNRWRKAVGGSLADTYRVARQQARAMAEELQLADGDDKYKAVMSVIEEKILASLQTIIRQDPMKLLKIRQDEEWLKIRERELQLKEKQHDFVVQQAEKENRVRTDRLKIGVAVWKYTLGWFVKNEPSGADVLTKRSNDFIPDLEEFLSTHADA